MRMREEKLTWVGCACFIVCASRRYEKLNAMAMQLVAPGGLLMTCTCSGAVTRGDNKFMQVRRRRHRRPVPTNLTQFNSAHLSQPSQINSNVKFAEPHFFIPRSTSLVTFSDVEQRGGEGGAGRQGCESQRGLGRPHDEPEVPGRAVPDRRDLAGVLKQVGE